ncbi:cereblon family protein [Spartinivicinus ruber]|uniref:cereblon family protein n=1 Tax=Spartinivicinus ruber TaxID=2683272 RepID=UPI0013D76917|nr:cereblon family protein [Spartinivicinus ruber]
MFNNYLFISPKVPVIGSLPVIAEPEVKSQVDELVELLEQPASALLCKHCLNTITYEHERIEISGQHIHLKMNPAGFAFEFGCFCAAPGCNQYGQYHSEATWFTGCSWAISLCTCCQQHLGWHFQQNDESGSFYGIILDKLVTSNSPRISS